MRKSIDLTGKTFGFLTVISRGKSITKKVKWLCKCNHKNCHNFTIVAGDKLRSGHTQSCGCLKFIKLRKEVTKHGLYLSREHKIWRKMKSRCLNPNDASYFRYGKRGITICESWINSFETFYCDMGISPSIRHSIERINNNLGYNKKNCKWALATEQAQNRRISPINKTGIRGVTTVDDINYNIQITANKQRYYLGYTKSLEEAKQLRIAGELKYWGKQLTF